MSENPNRQEFDDINNNIDNEVADEEISSKNVFTMSPVFKEIISWVVCLVIALAAAFVIRTWFFTVVKVEGQSMYPTLHDDERLITRIIGYTPKRSDIVIFHPKSNPKTAYVKRVIAVEGDRIKIDVTNGDVLLNKKGSDEWVILQEDYIAEKINPVTLGGAHPDLINPMGEGLLIEEDHIFVMGDNRNNSKDSRDELSVGQVHVDSVIGKATLRWWPLSRIGLVD